MKNFFASFLNIILPPRCICCSKIIERQNTLCHDCFAKIRFISKPYCNICGNPLEVHKTSSNLICSNCLNEKKALFTMKRSAFIYDDASKNILLDFKFHDKTSYAETIASFMFRAGKDIFATKPDLIVPVPLHYKRLIQRRYNQSALLAEEIAKLSGIKVNDSSLIRKKNTIPQVEFSGKARVGNVKNAFMIEDSENIKGKNIILIDDVMTTGSTLKECAKSLKRAGASNIYALTAARTSNK